jgi:hypothetical protein
MSLSLKPEKNQPRGIVYVKTRAMAGEHEISRQK